MLRTASVIVIVHFAQRDEQRHTPLTFFLLPLDLNREGHFSVDFLFEHSRSLERQGKGGIAPWLRNALNRTLAIPKSKSNCPCKKSCKKCKIANRTKTNLLLFGASTVFVRGGAPGPFLSCEYLRLQVSKVHEVRKHLICTWIAVNPRKTCFVFHMYRNSFGAFYKKN